MTDTDGAALRLQISVPGDETGEQLGSLRRWLRDDEDTRAVTIYEGRQPARPGELNNGWLQFLEIVLQPEGVVAGIVAAITAWLGTRRPGLRLRIRDGDREFEIEAGRRRDAELFAEALRQWTARVAESTKAPEVPASSQERD
ncbi:hypothetical protein ACGF3C_04505 [Micromonospora sp. NPDC047762]|uniref:effector-associated constant component EACC1 n=1 Tax=unclassified Micromonospora TaxID=2617518 RepID=UPI00340DDA00